MSLADRCRVVRCFVCGDYDKILEETAKFSGNIRVTETGLVTGVDRVLFNVGEFYVLECRRSSLSTRKECNHRLLLSLPAVWHTLHMHP